MLTLLPPANCVIALLQELVQGVGAVHVFKEFSLHLVLGKPRYTQSIHVIPRNLHANLLYKVEHDCLWYHVDHCPSHNVVVRVDQKF